MSAEQAELQSDRSGGIGTLLPIHGLEKSKADAMLAFLALWDELDASGFAFARVALGAELPELDWRQCCSWLLGNSLAMWCGDSATGAVRIRLRAVRNAVGGNTETSEALARGLLDAWLRNPDSDRLRHAVRWAVQLQAWDDLATLWLDHLHRTRLGVYPGVLEAFAGLPEIARRTAPLLTWAAALARAEAASEATRDDVLLRCVVADAMSLHINWRTTESTDAGVVAGMLVMLTQRAMPTSPVAHALDDAWATQAAVAAHIQDRRTQGRPPSSLVEAMFRATSAQLALARADFDQAAAEAEYAIAIDPKVGDRLAGGTRDLALELAACGSSARRVGTDSARGVNWLHRDPVTTDVISARLATAHAALRKLDRIGCARALDDLAAAKLGPTHWTTAVYLESLSAALWGDPTAALARLDSVKFRRCVAAVEQHERLGAGLLLRARIALLDRLGAHAAAKDSARGLPPSWRWAPRAHSLLWAGEVEESSRVAESGIYDPTTPLADRLSLRVIRAAAFALQEPAADHPGTGLALASVVECIDQHLLLPLGLLPRRARAALLTLCPNLMDGDPLCRHLAERVEALSRAGEEVTGPVQLTRREQVLMPLLASAESVPDIAHALHVSPNTVRKQVVTLRAKFDARNRAELVRRARDAGLLK